MPDPQLDHLLELLDPLEPSARAMFGGHGIYSGDVFFAIHYDGRLYFRVDDGTRQHYLDAGMEPFTPPKRRPVRSYYEVPGEVAASPVDLLAWARRAREAAARR